MTVRTRLAERQLVLPAGLTPPPGVVVPFAWARVHRDRVHLSGHGPQSPDGRPAGPFGKVGAEVTPEQGYAAAKLATLALIASLERAIGSLERVAAWLSISGHVAVAPGFTGTTNVLNGCSDLLLDIFGPETGAHARTAIGVAELPLGLPVVIAAEVAISDI
ncbi:MAG: RidA family protein [Sphingomonas sp.]